MLSGGIERNRCMKWDNRTADLNIVLLIADAVLRRSQNLTLTLEGFN